MYQKVRQDKTIFISFRFVGDLGQIQHSCDDTVMW